MQMVNGHVLRSRSVSFKSSRELISLQINFDECSAIVVNFAITFSTSEVTYQNKRIFRTLTLFCFSFIMR